MSETKKKSVYETLSAVDCRNFVEEKKNAKGTFKATYLSWAYAWGVVKQYYPEASYTIYEASNGLPYFSDGNTCFVKTGVTIEGLEHIEYLPIMDNSFHSIKVENVTSFDVNTAIQRSLTKACARHGLGLYIYAGEDVPFDLTVKADLTSENIDAIAKELLALSGNSKEKDARWQNILAEYNVTQADVEKITKKMSELNKPTPKKKPFPKITEDLYGSLVTAYARNKKSKTGLSPLEYIEQNFTYTEEDWVKFLNNVDEYKKHNII